MIASESMIDIGSTQQQKQSTVFDNKHRTLTIGILFSLTLVAFEALAVVTVAPIMGKSLDGMNLYGWIFSAQLLASLFSIILGGELADKHGPARPFIMGTSILAVGLAFAGFAPTMLVLIFGRLLQGLGAGAVVVAMYTAVNLGYADEIRPRMMAMMSTAWVVPSLVGPAIAGVIADALSWRYIFLIVLPFVIVVAIFVSREFLKLSHSRIDGSIKKEAKSNWPYGLMLAFGAGCLLTGLSIERVWLLAILVVIGGALALPNLGRLLPKGTFRFKAGLPSVIAARGFFYSSFIGVQAFLALMLTSVHGFSTATTGIALALASVSWTLGSWLQDKYDRPNIRNRSVRVRVGSSLMTVGLSIQLIALYTPSYPLIIALIGWTIGGLGIGLAHSTTSVLAFALAKKGEEGHVSAALQLVDSFIAALSTGIGGALFAFAIRQNADNEKLGIMLAFCFSLMLAVLSMIAAYKIREEP